MELQANASAEYLDTFYYCKPLPNNDSLCAVCLTDETEDGLHYDRYQTKCGHIFHTRCIRRWCGTKNCMNCPLCGNIRDIDANKWCYACQKIGHMLFSPKCAAYQEVYGTKPRRAKRR